MCFQEKAPPRLRSAPCILGPKKVCSKELEKQALELEGHCVRAGDLSREFISCLPEAGPELRRVCRDGTRPACSWRSRSRSTPVKLPTSATISAAQVSQTS